MNLLCKQKRFLLHILSRLDGLFLIFFPTISFRDILGFSSLFFVHLEVMGRRRVVVVGHGVDGLDGRRGRVVCVHSYVDVSSLDYNPEVDQEK